VKPYFDFTFLPLLLIRSGQAQLAATLAERFSLPWAVNYPIYLSIHGPARQFAKTLGFEVLPEKL